MTTQDASDITETSAIGHGSITYLGASNPTQHGHVWSTSQNPTVESYPGGGKTEKGAADSTGAFTSDLTGLTQETTYYVRAYAANDEGTSYGEQVEFVTLQAYTVSYNGNNQTSGTAPENQTKIHSQDLTLASNTGNLARNGYTFAGWNTKADGTGTDYAEGGQYTTNADLTLYAKWEGTEVTVETATGEGNATVKISAAHAAAGHVFTDVTAEDPPPAAPENVELPYGVIGFTITGLAADGDCSTVILEFPRNTAINTYYKYGPTQANPADHWYEFMYNGQTGAKINHTATNTEITLHLCDGLRGDSDLEENSVIDDPGGPGIAQAPFGPAHSIPTMNQWGLMIMSVLFVISALFMRRRGLI